jgi:hypothetical protein
MELTVLKALGIGAPAPCEAGLLLLLAARLTGRKVSPEQKPAAEEAIYFALLLLQSAKERVRSGGWAARFDAVLKHASADALARPDRDPSCRGPGHLRAEQCRGRTDNRKPRQPAQ